MHAYQQSVAEAITLPQENCRITYLCGQGNDLKTVQKLLCFLQFRFAPSANQKFHFRNHTGSKFGGLLQLFQAFHCRFRVAGCINYYIRIHERDSY
jgi:hypothetical protein